MTILIKKITSKKLITLCLAIVALSLVFLLFTKYGGTSSNKNFEITTIKERNVRAFERRHIQVDVYVPEAITKKERESVLKDIAASYAAKNFQFIEVTLRPNADKSYYNRFGSLGKVEYSPDGCNFRGKHCGWTKWDTEISNHKITEEDENHMALYIKNHKNILYDFNLRRHENIEEVKKINLEFRAAMANDLGISPGEYQPFQIDRKYLVDTENMTF